MNKLTNRGESRKRSADRLRNLDRRPEVPLLVRGPVYVAALGLFGVYAWGYLHAGLGGLAWGLVGVTAMSEMLKPQLGELAAHALDDQDRTAQRIVAAAALVCVFLGAGGGIVAMHVAEAPAVRRAAAERAVSDAGIAIQNAQAQVDNVPTCLPEMPASRCARMISENASVMEDRRARLVAAIAIEREARAALSRTPVAGPGLPNVGLWEKALFVGGAEFLMFGVPFAALRLRRRQRALAQTGAGPEATNKSGAKQSETQPILKANDGGWASRRAKYGPTGRKQKRQLAQLHVVGS